MKRHPAFHPLSHDHHHGLVIALRLKKGGPATPQDNWPADHAQQIEATLAFAKNELMPHFETEEKQLVGCVSGCEELETRVKQDHSDLRRMFAELEATSPEEASELLQSIGTRLEAHIRFEEREYFPRLQELLDEEALDRLAASLRR